jgi:hypothetical protein
MAYDPFQFNRAFEGMGQNALSNAMAMAQMRRQQQQDVQAEESNALAKQYQQMKIAELQRQQQESQATQGAMGEVYGNLDYLGTGDFNQRSGELATEAARTRPGTNIASLMEKMQGFKPTGEEYQIIDGQYVPKQPGGQAMPVPGYVKPEKTPLVNVGLTMPKQEEEFQKGMGKFYSEEFSGMQKEGREAHTNTARLGRAKSLVTNIATGKLRPAASAVKSVIKDLGYNLESYGLSDDVGMAEALKAVSIDLTMDTVQRTKGAVSNKEMDLFAQVAPQLSNTPEGNLLIIEMAEKLNQNKVQVAQLAREYLRKNSRYDEGFYDELDKFYDKNPLFTEEIYSKVNKLTGAAKEAQGRGIVGPVPAGSFTDTSDDDLRRILGIGK